MSRHPILVIGLTLAWIAACASTTGGGGSNTNWIRCESDQGCKGGQICEDRHCVVKSSSSATVANAPIPGDATADTGRNASADRRRDAGVDIVRDASPNTGAPPISPVADGGGIALSGICRVGAANGTSCDDRDLNTVGDSCTDGLCGGSFVSPCETSGDGGTFACHDTFSLVGAYWDGSVEHVDLVSASTGRGVEKGVLGDLQSWHAAAFIETADGKRVVAMGYDLTAATKLYVLDLESGITSSMHVARDYYLAGALPSGAIVGVGNFHVGGVAVADGGVPTGGGAISVDLIDPATGAVTTAGNLDGVSGWVDQLVLDAPRRRVYAIAHPDPDSPSSARFYSVDLSSGSLTSQPFAWGTAFLGGVAADGQIVMVSPWPTAPDGWFVGLVDPATATVTAWKGKMGDMYEGSYLVYDPTTHVARTVGTNHVGDPFLYSFDLATNVSSQVPAARPDYIFARQAWVGVPPP